MITCAVYARKSTDQNVTEEEKSVTRQVEHARAYAIRKGWQVAEEHVYSDDGISGAEFIKRPGFLRLMNAIKPRPAFQVLIMSEESRLGREQIETAYALKQITGAGVRVWFYLEDRERTLDSAMDKVMLSLATFASEMERERAKVRTRDAMQRKASRGHVAGGLVYGYRNREITAIGPNGQTIRDHVEREIIPAEAATVRRIFEEIAQGRGFARIAKGLTADGVPSPRLHQGWAPSGVREMVFRDLYRGRIVWGKTKWVDRGGTKVKQDRPESEWLSIDAPHLRIIPEELWQAAHDRLSRTRATYLRRTNGKL
jgi:DNA invertase Pin-like site-specific DNA recombinase